MSKHYQLYTLTNQCTTDNFYTEKFISMKTTNLHKSSLNA